MFPLVGFSEPLIALYWADADTTTEGSGTVFYRETQDPALLQRARSEILAALPGHLTFNPLLLFIATWYRVGYYNTRTDLVKLRR